MLNNFLFLLFKWRSKLIQNTVLKHDGTQALQGIDFIEQSAEGCDIAKLPGCYEQPRQCYIAAAIEKVYWAILNIVCAEGY